MEEAKIATLDKVEIRYITKDGRNYYSVLDLVKNGGLSEYLMRQHLDDEMLRENPLGVNTSTKMRWLTAEQIKKLGRIAGKTEKAKYRYFSTKLGELEIRTPFYPGGEGEKEEIAVRETADGSSGVYLTREQIEAMRNAGIKSIEIKL